MKKLLLIVNICLCVLLTGPTVKGQTTQQSAVWYQPPSSFPVWKARGMTILLGCTTTAEGSSADDWCKRAGDLGFDYILQSDGSVESHYGDPHCIGILLLPDEPNNAGAKKPQEVFTLVQNIKAKTNKPVLISLDAWSLQWSPKDSDIWGYVAAADWVALNWHVVNHGDGIQSLPAYMGLFDRIRKLGPNKRLFGFVEIADEKLNLQDWAQKPYDDTGKPWALRMHGPSIDEFLKEVKAMISGGITPAYFPDVIGKNWLAFDGTTVEMSAAITAFNSR